MSKGKTTYTMSTYIGESFLGLPSPVFYDPHYCIETNRPPVTLITGSPGSGKTFATLTLTTHSAIVGKTSFVLDPKGDFVAMKMLEKAGILNKVNIWSVMDFNSNEVADENTGMLDPTTLTEDLADNAAITIDMIKILVGDITATQNSSLTPIVRDVVESESPSFMSVCRKLKSNQKDEIRSLGFQLETVLQTPLASILVANRRIKKKEFVIEAGATTVATLIGLEFPDSAKSPNSYNSKEKVSICIMTLLTKMILTIMRKWPKSIKKLLCIDEAWTITSTAVGRNMVNSVALLGRSLNMAAIFTTQSPQHLAHEDIKIDTTVSSRLAFKNNNEEDNLVTTRSMKIPDEMQLYNTLPILDTGRCLYQDCKGSLGFIQVMVPDHWAKAFNTNPNAVLE